MQLVLPMTGEETAEVIVAALEYNGFKPLLVRMFAKAYDPATKEVILERVEVACEGIALKVRRVPEDAGKDPATVLQEKQRDLLSARLAQLQGSIGGSVPGAGSGGAPAPSAPVDAAAGGAVH